MLYIIKMYVKIEPSKNKDKKYTAIFYDDDKKKVKTTHFGQKNASDYTQHKDAERKQRYIERHKKNEKWNQYMTAGSLSFHILWSYTSLEKAKKEYARKFNLKLI